VLSVLTTAPGAHANESYFSLCGDKPIYVFGHHGFSFSQMKNGKAYELDGQLFRFGDGGTLYFRGRKCLMIECPGPKTCFLQSKDDIPKLFSGDQR
jgi:hypothetical protein